MCLLQITNKLMDINLRTINYSVLAIIGTLKFFYEKQRNIKIKDNQCHLNKSPNSSVKMVNRNQPEISRLI